MTSHSNGLADFARRTPSCGKGLDAGVHDGTAIEVERPSPTVVARRLIKERRVRDDMFGEDLGDPAWNMLLDLYVATAINQAVSVSSLCLAAGAPSTTALRYLFAMIEAEMVEKTPDPRDRRRYYVSLTSHTLNRLTAYFEAITCSAG
ncbi:hypothetical protein FPZ24_01885 [Sphingomonas panacisoli]|uniref:Uncharacterized protein n=1 Tax=Sphingomonas panacisoli TaxID=1813879 RepID=A0A5B8LF74_9SPHN|nr:winged helix DNA-binding protein [Sphingomonas panacisoli]QDZ06374.1 hypothetical protein FPZ24_01885 [Sphingomonas panacisoli]